MSKGIRPLDFRRRALELELSLDRREDAGRDLVEYLAGGTDLPLLLAWRTPPQTIVPRPELDAALPLLLAIDPQN